MSVYWSLGASLLEEGREKFDNLMKGHTTFNPSPMGNNCMNLPPLTMPMIKTLYEFYYNSETTIWEPWVKLVPAYIHDPMKTFSEILVPTVDSVRAKWLIELMVSVKRPTVLIGETGTSKTATIQHFTRNLDSDLYIVLNVNFSSRTTSMDVQRTLEASVEKRTKDTYGPVMGKRLLVFIDDMNMPQVDTYGTQQPIALLKTLFEKGGMYNRGKDLSWKYLKDIGYLAAMGKAGGGRNEVDPRFISLFSVFNMVFPSDETLFHIYNSILTGHLQSFAEVIISIGAKITQMTIQIYKSVVQELPPTPAKFHYIFNLRDLSRIYAGLSLTTPARFEVLRQFLRVWRNECQRVIVDRLITEDDKDLVNGKISEQVKEGFPKDVDYILRDPCLFGDYRTALGEDPRIYEDIQDYNASKALFQEIMEAYNELYAPMHLVLFNDALEHLTRVHRILRMNQGHALLVGVGGSGKQSLTKLSSFAAGCEIFEIHLSRGYSEQNLRDELKVLYNKLGIENKKMVFLFTDAHVVEEGFLELINNMLTSGMVPALFLEDEKESILNAMRVEATAAKMGFSKESIWQFFVNKCSGNMHIVLAMSPVGDTLRTRCRNFPGLVNNTSIDWFMPWPEQALFAVASVLLSDKELIPKQYRLPLIQHIVVVHRTVGDFSKMFMQKLRRNNYVTPKHYLDYITSYVKLLNEKDLFILGLCQRLAGGMTKIAEASVQLSVLNERLAVQQVVVAEKTLTCETLLVEIKEKTDIAVTKKAFALKKSKEIEEQSKIINVEKEDHNSSAEEDTERESAPKPSRKRKLNYNEIVEQKKLKLLSAVAERLSATKPPTAENSASEHFAKYIQARLQEMPLHARNSVMKKFQDILSEYDNELERMNYTAQFPSSLPSNSQYPPYHMPSPFPQPSLLPYTDRHLGFYSGSPLPRPFLSNSYNYPPLQSTPLPSPVNNVSHATGAQEYSAYSSSSSSM